MERCIELLGPKCAVCNNKNLDLFSQSFRFKTSVNCGHRLCSYCYENVFKTRKSIKCSVCNDGHALKKSEMSDKSIEAIQYDRERRIRKRVLSRFNLERSDFATEDMYLVYQEQAENVVWNLTNRVNLDEANELMEKNELENRDKIALRGAERLERDRAFAEEQQDAKTRKQHLLREMAAKERLERLMREQEKVEGNKVMLGEIKNTSSQLRHAQLELKRLEQERLAHEEREKRIKVVETYAPQTMKLEPNLWPSSFQEIQPHVDKAQMENEKRNGGYGALSHEELKAARRSAGGVDRSAVAARIEQSMKAVLLF